MSILNKLTEGIVNRDLKKEGDALLSKWEKTGLLEGLTADAQRNGMARLLENQAKQLLKEASSMAAGDVEGFASVAFPLVRRVFGGLLANDLVSVQPMSLPSGLIFFLDFAFTGNGVIGSGRGGQSVYGGGAVASEITGGISLTHGDAATDHTVADEQGRVLNESGFYSLRTGYAAATGSIAIATGATAPAGTIAGTVWDNSFAGPIAISAIDTEAEKKQINYDPDILNISDTTDVIHAVDITISNAQLARMDADNLLAFDLIPQAAQDAAAPRAFGVGGDEAGLVVRRLTRWVSRADVVGDKHTANAAADASLLRFTLHGSTNFAAVDTEVASWVIYPYKDNFTGADAIGGVVGNNNWPLEEPLGGTGNAGSTTAKHEIPEIDIKVDSIAVTAQTKKLKAKWSPELGQDLNAYHNLDAEVELTSILSEQIALEIDREILNDLVKGAKAAVYYWARSPGLFVNRTTGAEIGATSAAPDFTGTVSEWYETLIETINDVSAQIHRKTLRGGANFVVCSPEVANILEFTAGFRASVTADADRGSAGAVKTGSISKKFDVYVDPYFHRNIVLVGRKGGSFLESGYVYAPYVPLQVTPTIFGTEDFVPRKGVMTRYAKKMVRPDMYGLVIVRGLSGESGAST